MPLGTPARCVALFFLFFEAQGGGVDAKTKAGGLRAVFENMSQVRIAAAAKCFRAGHAVAHVSFHLDIFGSDWLVIAWPT